MHHQHSPIVRLRNSWKDNKHLCPVVKLNSHLGEPRRSFISEVAATTDNKPGSRVQRGFHPARHPTFSAWRQFLASTRTRVRVLTLTSFVRVLTLTFLLGQINPPENNPQGTLDPVSCSHYVIKREIIGTLDPFENTFVETGNTE